MPGGFFKHQGMEVHPANGAEEALNAMQVRKFDLLLTDLQMPGMDGFELTKKVRSIWPEMPIIMHTANLTPHHYNLAEMSGVSRVLDKSTSLQELLGIISRKGRGNVGSKWKCSKPHLPLFRLRLHH